ncbi:methanogen output domain 1-containing protein [Alteromonas sp. ASW11-19]|uniref:Methanogen output domain 1-containing protein n=1 Tax=Alteromonas salexigens TaxID=2982530 RepID=A0ABT2VMS1_9ALTE|nr:methanogen output domain 1-containing protein [Alteromonas salexigens]MCU7554379.1 methanogen output domain 1-containing protein [Alteromonas salexigens]
MANDNRIPVLQLPLERDVFLRGLIHHLAGTLEDVVGIDDASGFISVVGQRVGEDLNRQYLNGLNLDSLSREQVSDVLVDLKRRIKGDFFVIEEDDTKIVLGNRRCPFEDKVKDRPSMCMMTSNVFGTIAAENLGYARVELQETIATGSPQCRVSVHLTPTKDTDTQPGIEYYRAE